MTIRVVQITDTHIRPNAVPEFPPKCFADAVHFLNGTTTDESAALVVNATKEFVDAVGGIDLVVHTGDIVDIPAEDAYMDALALFERFDAPIFATPGNHDGVELMKSVFGDRVATNVGFRDLGGWRVLVVNSSTHGTQGGSFTDATLEELEAALDCDHSILIGVHHPPLSPCPDSDCRTFNAWQFLEIIDRHPNVSAVMSGHLHTADEIERRGVKYLLSPSTCLQLRHVHPMQENNSTATQSGARLVELRDDGSVETSVIWA